MTKDEAQEFVNEVEKRVMMYVQKEGNFNRMDELDEALENLDHSIMKVMEIITE